MEQLNGKRAALKKVSRGIASLAFMAAIVFFVGTAAVAPAHASISQTSQTVVKIPSPSEHDTFGYAVAVSGNTMVVGAQGGDGVIPPALPTARWAYVRYWSCLHIRALQQQYLGSDRQADRQRWRRPERPVSAE
jgi:hypothetical protein